MKAGDVLTKENVRAIRPGLGLALKYLDQVLGKKIKSSVNKGTALSWNLLP
jgi:N-acetylneuraminate synthase